MRFLNLACCLKDLGPRRRKIVYSTPLSRLQQTCFIVQYMNSVFLVVPHVKYYNYPRRRIDSSSILGTIVSPNKILLTWKALEECQLSRYQSWGLQDDQELTWAAPGMTWKPCHAWHQRAFSGFHGARWTTRFRV